MIYVVSKLFTYLFLPPGVFILALFLASLYVKRYKKVFLFIAVVFYMLSSNIVANLLLSPLESSYNKTLNLSKKADMVVVLGGGSTKEVANLPLGSDAFKRAIFGLMIAKKSGVGLIFSGGGLDKSYSEADAFLDTVKELKSYLGINLSNIKIYVDDKSLDTYQNAKYTKNLLSKLKIKSLKIYLVTSAYHMKRSQIIFEKFGFSVIPCATDFKIDHREYNFYDLLPNMGAFKKSYTALHEYFGIASLVIRDFK